MKLGSIDIGKVLLGNTEIGKAYLGSTLVYGSDSGGGGGEDVPIITLSNLFSSKSCGGYINTSSPYRWTSSTTYFGTIIDLQGYSLTKMRITRGASTTFFRYALLTTGTFTHYAVPSFCSGCSLVTNDTDASIVVNIPSDANYLFVYINSSGSDVSPTVELYGSVNSQEMKNLSASLFTANRTIGDNGTEYNGASSAPTICCSDYLPVASYSYNRTMQFIANRYPSGVSSYALNVVEYTTNKVFIKRDGYNDVPYTQALSPECGFVRILVACNDSNSQAITIASVLFDNDDIQVKGTDNS